jgi:hypothetical protein
MFFGFGAEPVPRPGRAPKPAEMAAGYALNRFEGLNNEPDMETPYTAAADCTCTWARSRQAGGTGSALPRCRIRP